VLDNAMAKMPETAKFCTHMLYLESEVVFGSQKRKPDMPIGDEEESHRLDEVTFTCPRVETRSSRTQISSCSLTNIQEECFSNPVKELLFPKTNSFKTSANPLICPRNPKELQKWCKKTQRWCKNI
jgi:hypothetical protein